MYFDSIVSKLALFTEDDSFGNANLPWGPLKYIQYKLLKQQIQCNIYKYENERMISMTLSWYH